jgi:hypothetical protein
MTWDRKFWGVEFKGGMKEDPPMILGAAWLHGKSPRRYDGEPTRALLFCTREQAREWCRNRRERSKDLGWKFTPVKVRELVEKVPNGSNEGTAL